MDGAVRDLATVTGQRPTVTKARKSIAQFKLREGMPIGAHVTLRGDRMWEFLDRLLSLALPRIRDFRGLSPQQFDGRGNYTFGLTEQAMFHEINQDRMDRTRGRAIVTRRSRNSYMRSRRSVTLQPIGMPSRSLKFATDLRARHTAGFCPLIRVSSLIAACNFFWSWVASPTPMLSTILSSRGICIGF